MLILKELCVCLQAHYHNIVGDTCLVDIDKSIASATYGLCKAVSTTAAVINLHPSHYNPVNLQIAAMFNLSLYIFIWIGQKQHSNTTAA